MGLLRTLVTVACLASFVWFGMTVELGQRTLFGHIKNIWAAGETQELVEGVKETSGPMVEKVKRGVEAGVREASEDDGDREPPDAGPPRGKRKR